MTESEDTQARTPEVHKAMTTRGSVNQQQCDCSTYFLIHSLLKLWGNLVFL